jgi:two-component system, NarL family, response regulator DevR
LLKVFIADDSVMVREKLRETLEDQALVKVIGDSGNAEQAITKIRQLDPQVVIIDIRMPGGGGMAVLKDLKAHTPDRIAIILTSYAYPEYRDAYLVAGADYFFDKTQDIHKLVTVLVELALKNEGPLDG